MFATERTRSALSGFATYRVAKLHRMVMPNFSLP
jgi:hypothetical protein